MIVKKKRGYATDPNTWSGKPIFDPVINRGKLRKNPYY